MIEISNGEESFFIENERLKKYKKYSKYINKNKHISVELVIFYDKTFRKNKIISIQKRLCSTGEPVGDLIKDFKILECNSNKITLSSNDYKELKKLVKNLNIEDIYREDVYVKAYSEIMAYECYLNYLVEELDGVSINDIFQYACSCCLTTKEKELYRNCIIQNTKKILKEKYGTDLEKIFEGVKENG